MNKKFFTFFVVSFLCSNALCGMLSTRHNNSFESILSSTEPLNVAVPILVTVGSFCYVNSLWWIDMDKIEKAFVEKIDTYYKNTKYLESYKNILEIYYKVEDISLTGAKELAEISDQTEKERYKKIFEIAFKKELPKINKALASNHSSLFKLVGENTLTFANEAFDAHTENASFKLAILASGVAVYYLIYVSICARQSVFKTDLFFCNTILQALFLCQQDTLKQSMDQHRKLISQKEDVVIVRSFYKQLVDDVDSNKKYNDTSKKHIKDNLKNGLESILKKLNNPTS